MFKVQTAMDSLSDSKLGIGVVVKADKDWRSVGRTRVVMHSQLPSFLVYFFYTVAWSAATRRPPLECILEVRSYVKLDFFGCQTGIFGMLEGLKLYWWTIFVFINTWLSVTAQMKAVKCIPRVVYTIQALEQMFHGKSSGVRILANLGGRPADINCWYKNKSWST